MKTFSCLLMVAALVACGDDSSTGAGGTGGSGGSGASGSGASGAGASGAGGTGAAGSGAAGSGAGGVGGTGGGTVDLSDCDDDTDCPADHTCVELIPGYRVCQAPIIEATGCGSKLDQCCESTDCDVGQLCVEAPVLPFCGGVQRQPYNVCGQPLCASDADCDAGSICAPAGTFGNQVDACIPNHCEGGCACGTVREACCNQIIGLYCIVDCQSTADCGAGEFCSEGTCIKGDIICPA